MRAVLPLTGPAVIASVAYMDPGNFATNIQAGARYGYDLLWVVVLANAVAMLFQALSAKLGIVTNRNLAELCRENFSRPVVIAMWIVSEIAAMATDLAEFLGGAIGLALLVPDAAVLGHGRHGGDHLCDPDFRALGVPPDRAAHRRARRGDRGELSGRAGGGAARLERRRAAQHPAAACPTPRP